MFGICHHSYNCCYFQIMMLCLKKSIPRLRTDCLQQYFNNNQRMYKNNYLKRNNFTSQLDISDQQTNELKFNYDVDQYANRYGQQIPYQYSSKYYASRIKPNLSKYDRKPLFKTRNTEISVIHDKIQRLITQLDHKIDQEQKNKKCNYCSVERQNSFCRINQRTPEIRLFSRGKQVQSAPKFFNHNRVKTQPYEYPITYQNNYTVKDYTIFDRSDIKSIDNYHRENYLAINQDQKTLERLTEQKLRIKFESRGKRCHTDYTVETQTPMYIELKNIGNHGKKKEEILTFSRQLQQNSEARDIISINNRRQRIKTEFDNPIQQKSQVCLKAPATIYQQRNSAFKAPDKFKIAESQYYNSIKKDQKYKESYLKTRGFSSSPKNDSNIIQRKNIILKNGKVLNEQIEKIQQRIETCSTNKKKILQQNTQNVRLVESSFNPNRNSQLYSANVLKQQNYKPLTETKRANIIEDKLKNVPINLKKQLKQSKMISSSQIKSTPESLKLINYLIEQFNLDINFKNSKKWFDHNRSQSKWKDLQQACKSKGLSISPNEMKIIFSLSDDQNDPFYSVRLTDDTIFTMLAKYQSAEKHWRQNIEHKFSKASICQGDFYQRNLDINSKGYIEIQDFIRFINFKTQECYSIRDIYPTYRRITKRSKVSYEEFLKIFLQ